MAHEQAADQMRQMKLFNQALQEPPQSSGQTAPPAGQTQEVQSESDLLK